MRARGKKPTSSDAPRSNSVKPISTSIVLLIAVSFAALAAVFGSPRRLLAQSAAPSAISTAMPAPTSAAQPISVSSPVPGNQAVAVSPTNPQTVIAYLSDVIGWYHHLGVEAQ